MVEQDQPRPAPRPNLPFADDVNAASFNDRWEAERYRAAQLNQSTQPKGNDTMSDDTKNRPAETLREGSLKAAIWRNESERGGLPLRHPGPYLQGSGRQFAGLVELPRQ